MAAFLLALCPGLFAAGEGELSPVEVAQVLLGDAEPAVSPEPTEIPPECADLTSDELLALADEHISTRDIEAALDVLDCLLRTDDEYLEEAELRFRQIRAINMEYEEKGREVLAQLQKLLSEDIAPEDLLPAAVEALSLIAEMEEILPRPNARDALIVEDLRYRVQLNIDRRRFATMMDAAADKLASDDFAGAADIYINGIDDSAQLTGSGGDQSVESLLISLENGVDMQRRFFEERDYGLLSDQVVSTREALRSIGNQFVSVGPQALEGAAQLADAFSAGEFGDAAERVAEYIQLLSLVTGFVLRVDDAGASLTDAELLVADQAVADENTRYDWHIRFLRDIVLGREDASSPEGLIVIVNTVTQAVGEGPVFSARSYGDSQYEEAVALLDSIRWPQVATGFSGMAAIDAAVTEAEATLSQAAASYLIHAQILAVGSSIDLAVVTGPTVAGSVTETDLQSEWIAYSDSAIEALAEYDAIPDAALRSEIERSHILATSANLLRRVGRRGLEGVLTALARRTTVSSLQNQRLDLQAVLGSLDDPAPGTQREIAEQLARFASAVADRVGDDELAGSATERLVDSSRARIADLERYELQIVQAIANLEYNALSARLSSLQSRTSDAQRQLDGIPETVNSVDESGRVVRNELGQVISFQTVRKYPDRAREILVPMVGPVSGTRIISTASGEFQTFLDDASAFVTRYEQELPYISGASPIRNQVEAGRNLMSTVGTLSDPALFRRGRDMLREALIAIETAEELEDLGDARVEEVRDLILEARAASDAERLDVAGDILARAEQLLKSDEFGVNDASDFYTDSLAAWYRPALERRWNSLQSELNDQIANEQTELVLIRVQQAVDEAQPLADNQLWADALGILRDAEERWASVFPQNIYPPLVRLLRIVETALAKQNERVLREDDPDFDKLAPLLSRATQAVNQRLFSEAALLLDQFLAAQPNNLEARLLQVDIALQAGDADLVTKIDRLIANSLPEGASRANLGGLEPADALELQSLLIAILERLTARTDASAAVLTRLRNDFNTLEALLNPPRIVVATPDLRADAGEKVQEALSNGPLETLSRSELATALGLLEEALGIDPTNQEALELLSRALRLPNAPRREALDATEQQIFKEARDAFSRGNLTGALVLVEQLWADPDNRNDTELNRFREELQDALRRGQ